MVNLDNRVEMLEDNGGDGGNITALEGRVTDLETRVDIHDTGIAQLNQSMQEIREAGTLNLTHATRKQAWGPANPSLGMTPTIKYYSTAFINYIL